MGSIEVDILLVDKVRLKHWECTLMFADSHPGAATPTRNKADEVLQPPFQVRIPYRTVCKAPPKTGAHGRVGDAMRRQDVTNEQTPCSWVRLASDGTANDLQFVPKKLVLSSATLFFPRYLSFQDKKWAEVSGASSKGRRTR
jgi:hypothetical protein